MSNPPSLVFLLHIYAIKNTSMTDSINQYSFNIISRLSGPNTGIGWICEGRRRIPLMPRSIPQTAYTEIADKAAEAAAAENKELQKKLEAEKLIAPKSSEEQYPDPEHETAEGAPTNDMDELLYPPIAMEDETLKVIYLTFFFERIEELNYIVLCGFVCRFQHVLNEF